MARRSYRLSQAFVGIVLLAGLLYMETAHANRTLTRNEMESVVGGLAGCEMFSVVLDGYHCGSFRSFACETICSPCQKYSDNEILCEIKKCWACEPGVEEQIIECIVGEETDACHTFGTQPENSVCGLKQDTNCIFSASGDRCFCPTPLFDTETPCPRRDCMDP